MKTYEDRRSLGPDEPLQRDLPLSVLEVQTSTWYLLSRLWLSSQDGGLEQNPYIM
jgi:hypothetical protein